MKFTPIFLIVLTFIFSRSSWGGAVEAVYRTFEQNYTTTAKELDQLLKTETQPGSAILTEGIQHEAYLALIAAEDISEAATHSDEKTKKYALHTSSRLRQLSRHLFRDAAEISKTSLSFDTYLHTAALNYLSDQAPLVSNSEVPKTPTLHKHHWWQHRHH